MNIAAGAVSSRAVWRWAVRLVRRDWRQQLLIGVLLGFVMAVAVFGVAAAYNVAPTRDGDFGSANHRVQIADADNPTAYATLIELREWFGTIEVIAHRDVNVPGLVGTLELRNQPIDGPYGGPMLHVLGGRLPGSDDEIALTDGAADVLGVELGATTTVDGLTARVVGIVENPGDLDDEFVLMTDLTAPDRYTVLIDAKPERVAALPEDVHIGAVERRPACHAVLICASAGQSEQTTAAVGALAMATLLLLLVALIATAGFVVVAQRRLRQIAMFAAIGASNRQVSTIVLANGLIVGLVASVLGAATGVIGWLLTASTFEASAGHRIDRFHVPWLLTMTAIVLGTAAAGVASWKPARALRRASIGSALAARPPRPRSARRSALVALGSGTFGILVLTRAVDQQAEEIEPVYLVGGITALVAALVYLTPGVLGAIGYVAGRLPVGPRIALRDVARYRARTSTALAAIALVITIPTVAVVAASAASHGSDEGNLSDRQALIRIGDDRLNVPERTSADLALLEDRLRPIANRAEADLIPLQVPVDPTESSTRGVDIVYPTVVLGQQTSESTVRDVDTLYLATPLLIDQLNLSAVTVAGAEVLTPHLGSLVYANTAGQHGAPDLRHIEAPRYRSMPRSLITARSVRNNGWVAAPAGWLLEAPRAIDGDLARSLRETAASAGLTVELRDDQRELGLIRVVATGLGILASLGVLALTLALLRVEARREIQTLAATGAAPTLLRTINAARAGCLAATGALLGVGLAYAGMIAGYGSERSSLAQVPVFELGALLMGLPLIAFSVSWLLSGPEPAELRRQIVE